MLAATASPLHDPAALGGIRVLIADDSAVVRGLVARWIGDAGFSVVGTASNGKLAVEMMARHDPDVVLLDIDMPELDGTQALPKLLAISPGAQIVMMSTLTTRNADISLKCLALGAVDYLAKPESNRGVTTSDAFRNELVERVRTLGSARRAKRGPLSAPPVGLRGTTPAPAAAPAAPAPVSRLSGATSLRAKPRTVTPPKVLLVGSSTGGPRAVGEVLEKIGAATLRKLPTLIVQHMPPVFTAVFAEHLGARTGIPSAEGKNDERLVPGRIYVAPGGRHMKLAGGREPVIRLDDGPLVNFCRPAVDVLFHDAAAMFGPATLSVILTGMGSDGTNGVRSLGDAGGMVVVQDEATSTVWGMPGSAAKAGLAHAILPLGDIGAALRTLINGSAA